MRTQQTNVKNAQQSKKNRKRYAAVAVAGVIGLATAGGAYSYWTSLGTGAGTATTSTGSSSVFTVTGGAIGPMFPGDKPQGITATVTNSGSENYKLQAVKVYITTGNAACDTTNYLINGSQAPGSADTAASTTVTPVELAPKDTTNATFSIQFNDKATNQDACKGQAVTIHYLAS